MATSAQSTKPEAWPTIEQAAAQLGVSVRTIWRYKNEGAIQVKKRARPGKKPENVCNPRDIARLLPPADDAPQIVTPAGEAIALRRQAQAAVALRAKPWEGALERIAALLADREKDRVPGTLWLNIDQAVAYSGLAKSDLLELCRSGKIGSRKSGGWKIRRKSLDDFSG